MRRIGSKVQASRDIWDGKTLLVKKGTVGTVTINLGVKLEFGFDLWVNFGGAEKIYSCSFDELEKVK